VVIKKVAIVTIIPAMVMNKYMWIVNKFTNYMPKKTVPVIMLVKPVRIRIVAVVIVLPAIVIPSVSFPTSVPMRVFIMIIVVIKLIRIIVIVHFF